MSEFTDYIDGLEGKDNLDPLKIAQDLHELYTHDVETRDAKIAEVNGVVAERDTTIAEKEKDVQRFKAMNLDLMMQLPGQSKDDRERNVDDPNTPEGRAATITPDDLFS